MMARNDFDENNELLVNCEDTEMIQYKKSALNVVSFYIVHEENDLENPHRKANLFKPDMAHQIFGETEMIFGYKYLSINLYYLHNSAKCFVDVHLSEKIAESEGCKADDIMEALNPWLPMNYKTNKEDFMQDLKEENHAIIHGDIIHTFKDSKGKTYKVTLCNLKDNQFKEFHQRFETFIVWFIDGANYIDLEDERWTIFYVYEEYLHPHTNTLGRTPVGFCTVYNFFLYPNLTRPRISQFFVLPTHQRRGVGTKLYSAVYKYLLGLPDSGDITVEEPTEIFQKIRDYCDSLHIYNDLEHNKISISTQNQKKINELMRRYKICKRQAQRIFDILECLVAHKNGYEEYKKFTNSIKARIANNIEKETKGSKRLCNLQRCGVISETIDKNAVVDAEFSRYVNSLEWPTNRLRAHLFKISN